MSYNQALCICTHLVNVVAVRNMKHPSVFANLNVVAIIANIHFF